MPQTNVAVWLSGGSRGRENSTMVPIQLGYRLWLPSNEEMNVRYWETLNCPLVECLDPLVVIGSPLKLLIHSFIHSGHFYSASSVHHYSEALPYTARMQATVSKGLAQGPYVAARAGVEPTTLRLRVIDSPRHHVPQHWFTRCPKL